MSNGTEWLLEIEPKVYKDISGDDPYAIWVTKLDNLEVKKIPARLLSYADEKYTKAHIIYLNGTRDIVFEQQMSKRTP